MSIKLYFMVFVFHGISDLDLLFSFLITNDFFYFKLLIFITLYLL